MPTPPQSHSTMAPLVAASSQGLQVSFPRHPGFNWQRGTDPKLSLADESIPSVGFQPFKFLGMPVKITRNITEAKLSLKKFLERMLVVVEKAPVTRHQKLRLFKQGVCPRLTWPFLVENLPISWFEK